MQKQWITAAVHIREETDPYQSTRDDRTASRLAGRPCGEKRFRAALSNRYQKREKSPGSQC